MFDSIGFGEILIIVLVIIVLFGAKKIPELAKGMGKGIKEFKKAVNDIQEDINTADIKIEDKKNR